MRTLLFIPTLVTLASMLWLAPVCAQAREDGLTHALRAVPADADFCLAVRDGASLRRTVPGRFIRDAFETFAPRNEATRDASTFATVVRSLGLESEDDPFDRLLGTSFVFVMRRADDGELGWALRSDVSKNTFAILRRELAPAPREVVNGRTLYSVEDGRFRMFVDRSEEGATLTIAPADSDALLREMLRAAGDESLTRRGVFPGSDTLLDEADALCYADLSALSDEPDDRGPAWVGLTANVHDTQVAITALVRAPDLAGPADMPFRPWPARWFNELEPNAIALAFDRTNSEMLELVLGAPDEGRKGILPWQLPAEVSVFASHRAAAYVRARKGGGLDMALAMETDDVRALANAIDNAMPELLACDERTYVGLPVSAVRTCDVDAVTPLIGDRGQAQLAWNFRIAGDCNEDQESGWWAVGLGPSAVSALGRALSLEPLVPEEQQLPLISKGVVRPSLLISAARDAGLDFGVEGALVARIHEVSWDEVFAGSDMGLAAITLSFHDDRGSLAGRPVDDEAPAASTTTSRLDR